jgi:hypothetical protein
VVVRQAPVRVARAGGPAGCRAVIGGLLSGRAAGSDLAAEGEGVDGAAEGPAEGGGYHVLVFFGGDAGQVGRGGVLAERGGGALVADQLAELGCQMANFMSFPMTAKTQVSGNDIVIGADGIGPKPT